MDIDTPSCWLPRPAFQLDEATIRAFDSLLDSSVAHGADLPIDYAIDAPHLPLPMG